MSLLNASVDHLLNQNYWGPVTATLDWCEANYQFTRYLAEAANTFSNLITIAFAWYGGHLVNNAQLPKRFLAGWTGFVLVGVGSFIFHATLQYEAQLADELPMIYVASYCSAVLFDLQPGFSIDNAHSRFVIAFLLVFNVVFTCFYALYRNPVFHQLTFGVIMVTTAIRTVYILHYMPGCNTRIPPSVHSRATSLFGSGAAFFVFGFIVWNLDNIFCNTVTEWKQYVGWPAAFLLEGHSWWHILTALGTYLMLIGNTYLTLGVKDSFSNYEIRTHYGLPGVYRTGKTKVL